jgi:hypothetical protein
MGHIVSVKVEKYDAFRCESNTLIVSVVEPKTPISSH